MLSAFQYLHEENIVHRDLKAENLMLDDQHNLKIIDFGLSNDMTGKEYLDTQCGSMAYSAPELLGSYNYGKEVDIWSIGVCLYVRRCSTRALQTPRGGAPRGVAPRSVGVADIFLY